MHGCDLSGFTNATLCEWFDDANVLGPIVVSNCLAAATWGLLDGYAISAAGSILATNCGPETAPTFLVFANDRGAVISSASIYRTGGAQIESTACSWLCTTDGTATAAEGNPFLTPWIYGTTTAGSKTFTLYITNDTADFTDAQVWLEVEYLGTDDEAKWELVTDQRATILTTAAAQTDDTTSTWNGAGPSYTYKQSLVCASVSVGEAGLYRARVAVGLTGIAAGRYFYIDPKVTVS
jgi:hypothetical protein